MPPAKQYNAWVFTRNVGDDEWETLKQYDETTQEVWLYYWHGEVIKWLSSLPGYKGSRSQIENGDGNGRPHIQGYLHRLQLETKSDIMAVHKDDNRFYVPDRQKGTNAQNDNYCCSWTNQKKPTARYQIAFGDMWPDSEVNINRSTLATIHKHVQDRKYSLDELSQEFPVHMIMHGTALTKAWWRAWSLWRKSNPIDVICDVLFGVPGSGKTVWATEQCTESWFILPQRSKGAPLWFGNYAGEHTLIIDEFDWHEMTLTEFNRIVNRPVQDFPAKGGWVCNLWRRVIVTTNLHPRTWWPREPLLKRAAYQRRISHVWVKNNVYPAVRQGLPDDEMLD